MADAGGIDWKRENYQNELLDGAFLVIAATDDRGRERRRDAGRAGARTCSSAGPTVEDGNFTTPAVVRRGDLVLTVTTGGKSPTLAALLRERLADEFGPEWEGLTALLGRLRERRSDARRRGGAARGRAAHYRRRDDARLLQQGNS